MEELQKYKYIIIPAIVWGGIQLFKGFYNFFETGKWDWKRFLGLGGMPSSHSAVVMCLTILVAKNEGIETSNFATTLFFAIVVMTDAIGVRRTVGKQSKVLNEILKDNSKSGFEKLQEMTGHTPFQVLIGALIGIIVGIFLG